MRRYLLILSLLLIVLTSFGQEVKYYKKIELLVSNQRSYSRLYQQIDSLKQTRQPHNSHLNVSFNRDIDFGYKHQRLDVTFNGTGYLVDFVLKADSIIFSHTSFDNTFEDFYKKYQKSNLDTVACLSYLSLRNKFYSSTKKLSDLTREITLAEDFAFNCGEAMSETEKGKEIKKLVSHKNIKALKSLLKSISCEEQAYGAAGFEMLKFKGMTIPGNIEKLIGYLKQRDSEIQYCMGCLMGVIRKPSQL